MITYIQEILTGASDFMSKYFLQFSRATKSEPAEIHNFKFNSNITDFICDLKATTRFQFFDFV